MCAFLLWVPLAAAADPLPDAQAREVLAALEGESGEAARAAIERILEARDERFAAPLIELIRASEIGAASPGVRPAAAGALEQLTGQSFGTSWADWVRWYAGTSLEEPPGFTSFKGRLLGRIDPEFESLLRDETPRRIRAAEVVWGGVPFEGIPSLDRPKTLRAADATYLEPGEPVFGVALGGEARAYPLRILDWHEMANDEVGGTAFALAYCTLCGSGIAYDTRVAGLGVIELGSSGFLMRSNKLMVDRGTRTLWNQVTGRPVLGPLADRDLRLRVLPSVVTTWAAWRAQHPETTVLSLATGHRRPYEKGAAYAGYFASPDTMFPVRRARDELPAKARVFALERDGASRVYPVAALLEQPVLNDAIAGDPVVVLRHGDEIWVDGESVRAGPARYSAGAEVRAYARGAHRFRSLEAGQLVDAQGSRWRIDEDALVAADGERLARVPGVLAYWFGWTSFYPSAELYTPQEGSP